jgi:hypothetical protein
VASSPWRFLQERYYFCLFIHDVGLAILPLHQSYAFHPPILVSLARFSATSFVHPGLLHTAADFTRISTKVAAGTEPWNATWTKFIANPYASASYIPQVISVVYRGSDGTHDENYYLLYQDVAAAYALAIRWKITGIAQYGNAAINILDAWSSNLSALGGNNDLFLAAGIYGYEFAQAREIMRCYTGWTDFTRFRTMMVNILYSQINEWFVNHDAGTFGQNAASVYAGWDLSMMAGAVAIGIMADDETIYNPGATGSSPGPVTDRSSRLSHTSTGTTTKSFLKAKKRDVITDIICWILHCSP